MITLYLASYMEPDNHGPGRKIAITDTKPRTFEVDAAFTFFIPPKAIINEYRENQLKGQEFASEQFSKSYESILTKFFDEAYENADKTGLGIQGVLPFKDGDTLLFWERKGFRSCRKILAKYLEDAGYKVELR